MAGAPRTRGGVNDPIPGVSSVTKTLRYALLKRLLPVLTAASLAGASPVAAQPPSDAPAATTPIRFTLDRPVDGVAAPFVVATTKGYFRSEALSVTTDVAKGTASLLPPAASLLQLGAGRIIGNDGASLITNDGGSLITNDGGSLITNDGGSRLFVDQVALRRKKKRTRYLLVLISYVKKTVTKGKRVVLKLHYTRAGKKLLKAAHKRDRHLRAHHRKREPKGILLDVEFKKRGAKHAIRATQPVYVHARK